MTKWRKINAKRYARGPLRVYAGAGVDSGWWFAGLKLGRVVEDIDTEMYYDSAEAAMKAADKWAREIARLLKAIEAKECPSPYPTSSCA